ncbi:MAG: 4a-hydroxytetrahydrobiopterin dehydratase [Deltaproteobacteria bacterium]|nr:4a-hydroxytetrahydrobiopterin dehydratase [Deltaproteobacteria bacterium]
MGLAARKCVPCTRGAPPMEREQAVKLLEETPGWELSTDARKISRKFTFRDFAAAMSFVGRVGELAEQEGHHPDIAFGWGYSTVTFWTHKIGGLHENDFIMAAKVTDAFERK